MDHTKQLQSTKAAGNVTGSRPMTDTTRHDSSSHQRSQQVSRVAPSSNSSQSASSGMQAAAQKMPNDVDHATRQRCLHDLYSQLRETYRDQDDAVLRDNAGNIEYSIWLKASSKEEYAQALSDQINSLLYQEIGFANRTTSYSSGMQPPAANTGAPPSSTPRSLQEFTAHVQQLTKSNLIELLWNQRHSLLQWQTRCQQLEAQIQQYQAQMRSMAYGPQTTPSAGQSRRPRQETPVPAQVYWERVASMRGIYAADIVTATNVIRTRLEELRGMENSDEAKKFEALRRNLSMAVQVLNERPPTNPHPLSVLDAIEQFLYKSIVPMAQHARAKSDGGNATSMPSNPTSMPLNVAGTCASSVREQRPSGNSRKRPASSQESNATRKASKPSADATGRESMNSIGHVTPTDRPNAIAGGQTASPKLSPSDTNRYASHAPKDGEEAGGETEDALGALGEIPELQTDERVDKENAVSNVGQEVDL